jgi:methionine-rich copper-binding protein CopC
MRAVLRRMLLAGALLLPPVAVWAHAFPDHSDPRVGSTVPAPPAQVRIWFDGEIEPVFSTMRVEDAEKRRVDRGDARVNPQDHRILEVSVPLLPAGKYYVFWSVIARDGHRTEGDFRFLIQGK